MQTRRTIIATILLIMSFSFYAIAQVNENTLENTYMGATYYGGSDYDYSWANATDSENNFYVVGITQSLDFPVYDQGGGSYYQGTMAGGGDTYILKFNSDGERLWATYYGGNSTDHVNSIAVDENDNILLTGITYSDDFPVFDPGGGAYFQGPSNNGDVFIIKFNSNGERLWATCYGGHDGMAYQEGYSITSDLNNNIIVTGNVESTNFPVFNPGGAAYYQNTLGGTGDAFILKFNVDGIRQWATYYGGTDFEYGHSIATDGEGNILITGLTLSYDFPVFNPGSGVFFQGTQAGNGDAFILKFDQNGVRQWATYYGGNEDDRGRGICAGENNSILLTGKTLSPDLPLYNPGSGAYYEETFSGFIDAFILKFNINGVREWATYYNYANILSITTDNNENILLTGVGYMGFLTYDPGGGAYIQDNLTGGGDAGIIKFNKNLELIWATCYGGFDPDNGYGIATDLNNKVFVSGMSQSTDFPVFNPTTGAYFQGINAGETDATILCFDSTGVISGPVGITGKQIETGHILYQNQPNPCNNFTEIKYYLSEPGYIQIELLDLSGRKIKAIIDEFQQEGEYHHILNTSDLKAGIYLYKMSVNESVVGTRRLEIL